MRKNADKSGEQNWIPEKYFHGIQDALDRYEQKHPHWRIEVLVSFIKWGIRNLKHCIEQEPGSRITWDNPLVELHYPVEWDWKSPRDGDKVYGKKVLGKLTKENTSDAKTAAKTVAEMMARRFNTLALGDFTNGAWFEKRDNTYIPYLPSKLDAAIKQIKGKRKKREALEELYRPFSIGATRIDISDSGLKENTRIPRRVAKQLETMAQRMDIAGISFSGDVNGRKIWSGLIFEIQPLMIDYDMGKAYHAVTVGLAFERKLVGFDVISLTPSDWPKNDRKVFWDELLREVDTLTDRLIPKTESGGSVILSVNAQLKVPAIWWRPESRSAEIKKITDALAQGGVLEKLNVQAAPSGTGLWNDDTCPVCGWMHNRGFTQMKIENCEAISLGGILPEIVRLVHEAHEKGFNGLSTKDDALLETCGGYGNPCKAFDDLNQRTAYKLLFDTRRRGFISLHGALGRNRNKTETDSE